MMTFAGHLHESLLAKGLLRLNDFFYDNVECGLNWCTSNVDVEIEPEEDERRDPRYGWVPFQLPVVGSKIVLDVLNLVGNYWEASVVDVCGSWERYSNLLECAWDLLNRSQGASSCCDVSKTIIQSVRFLEVNNNWGYFVNWVEGKLHPTQYNGKWMMAARGDNDFWVPLGCVPEGLMSHLHFLVILLKVCFANAGVGDTTVIEEHARCCFEKIAASERQMFTAVYDKIFDDDFWVLKSTVVIRSEGQSFYEHLPDHIRSSALLGWVPLQCPLKFPESDRLEMIFFDPLGVPFTLTYTNGLLTFIQPHGMTHLTDMTSLITFLGIDAQAKQFFAQEVKQSSEIRGKKRLASKPKAIDSQQSRKTVSMPGSKKASVKPKKRMPPGKAALQEIQRLQKTEKLQIPKTAFYHFVHELTQKRDETARMQLIALQALHEFSEQWLTRLFEDVNLVASCAGRVTILPKDLHTVILIRNDDVSDRWKNRAMNNVAPPLLTSTEKFMHTVRKDATQNDEAVPRLESSAIDKIGGDCEVRVSTTSQHMITEERNKAKTNLDRVETNEQMTLLASNLLGVSTDIAVDDKSTVENMEILSEHEGKTSEGSNPERPQEFKGHMITEERNEAKTNLDGVQTNEQPTLMGECELRTRIEVDQGETDCARLALQPTSNLLGGSDDIAMEDKTTVEKMEILPEHEGKTSGGSNPERPQEKDEGTGVVVYLDADTEEGEETQSMDQKLVTATVDITKYLPAMDKHTLRPRRGPDVTGTSAQRRLCVREEGVSRQQTNVDAYLVQERNKVRDITRHGTSEEVKSVRTRTERWRRNLVEMHREASKRKLQMEKTEKRDNDIDIRRREESSKCTPKSKTVGRKTLAGATPLAPSKYVMEKKREHNKGEATVVDSAEVGGSGEDIKNSMRCGRQAGESSGGKHIRGRDIQHRQWHLERECRQPSLTECEDEQLEQKEANTEEDNSEDENNRNNDDFGERKSNEDEDDNNEDGREEDDEYDAHFTNEKAIDPPSISMAPVSTSHPPASVESTPPSPADADAEELASYTADLEPAVRDLIQEYHDVFPSSFSYAGIPPMRDVEHSIQLVPDYRVHHQAPYRLSIPEVTKLKRQLEELLRLGFIKPSNSLWGAPVLFARKADETLRLYIDYRGLNRYTIMNNYPMPRSDKLFDCLAGNLFFTKIDLRSGYHQIRVAAADQPKTAFQSPFGHYKFTVMPFGLTNAPASFQRAMNDIFRDILEKYVLVYLDDILVYSRTLEEHLRHLHDVLDRLRRHGFYAKLSKCRFALHKVDFLGHYVSDKGHHMDDAKITAIAEWPVPTSAKQLRSFLGLTSYYSNFIQGCARYSYVLISTLLRKNPPWAWTPLHEDAFRALKKAVTCAPILQLTDFDRPLSVCLKSDSTGVWS
ncbi:hypothetical protein CBR_g37046 [Chara braunii]|uniref:Reverse transcriptase domain-containing protein n=1 Tax=Chara braunii TaxID=69332 RepID=A0A388LM70_CHABU|nr:hypothetical protein CBR_g37046 [Chara braunii]|eukprot:GBG83333.1 hypothetical protein CBR_g37046 [Chara braunii]